MTVLTIGGLAEAAGVGVETVRYYERRGLLPEPARSPAGYRQYGEADVWRLAFIRRAKALGFTLGEIAGLLAAGQSPCHVGAAPAVRAAATAKLAAVDEELRALAEVRSRLAGLVAACAGGDDEGCAALAVAVPG